MLEAWQELIKVGMALPLHSIIMGSAHFDGDSHQRRPLVRVMMEFTQQEKQPPELSKHQQSESTAHG